jgi:hypothetical protein
MHRLLAWLLALPPTLALGAVLTLAAGERLGLRPLARPVLRNSAEAAASADAASMLQLMAREPLGTMHTVRPGLLSSGIVKATTVEAAMWSGHVELIEVLDRRAAVTTDPEERASLACLARDIDADAIAVYLAGAVPACEPGAALRRMQARAD